MAIPTLASCQLRLQSNDSVIYTPAQSAPLTANNFKRPSAILFTHVKRHTISASSPCHAELAGCSERESMIGVLLKSTGLFFMVDILLVFAVCCMVHGFGTLLWTKKHISRIIRVRTSWKNMQETKSVKLLFYAVVCQYVGRAGRHFCACAVSSGTSSTPGHRHRFCFLILFRM